MQDVIFYAIVQISMTKEAQKSESKFIKIVNFSSLGLCSAIGIWLFFSKALPVYKEYFNENEVKNKITLAEIGNNIKEKNRELKSSEILIKKLQDYKQDLEKTKQKLEKANSLDYILNFNAISMGIEAILVIVLIWINTLNKHKDGKNFKYLWIGLFSIIGILTALITTSNELKAVNQNSKLLNEEIVKISKSTTTLFEFVEKNIQFQESNKSDIEKTFTDLTNNYRLLRETESYEQIEYDLSKIQDTTFSSSDIDKIIDNFDQNIKPNLEELGFKGKDIAAITRYLNSSSLEMIKTGEKQNLVKDKNLSQMAVLLLLEILFTYFSTNFLIASSHKKHEVVKSEEKATLNKESNINDSLKVTDSNDDKEKNKSV